MPNFTFRFTDDEAALIDSLATTRGYTRVELVRAAVAEFDARYGQRAATDVISGLIARYGADATLTFTNNMQSIDDAGGSIYDVQTTVEPGLVTGQGEPVSPTDPIGERIFTRWDVDASDNITVWIEPRTTDANPPRVLVGKMLHRPSASLSVKLIDLLPTSVLRSFAADGSVDEVRLTAAQAADLRAGKAIGYIEKDESEIVDGEGRTVRRSSAF